MKHLRSTSLFVFAALLAAGCGDSADSGSNKGLSFRGKPTEGPFAGSSSDTGVVNPASTGGTSAMTGTRASGATSNGGTRALAGANGTGGSAPMVEGGTGGTQVQPDGGVGPGIHIVSATYGAECGVSNGNVTNETAALCAGRQTTCDIWVGNASFVDPVYGCAKGFIVIWTCGTDPTEHTASHEAVVGEDFYVSIACQ